MGGKKRGNGLPDGRAPRRDLQDKKVCISTPSGRKEGEERFLSISLKGKKALEEGRKGGRHNSVGLLRKKTPAIFSRKG